MGSTAETTPPESLSTILLVQYRKIDWSINREVELDTNETSINIALTRDNPVDQTSLREDGKVVTQRVGGQSRGRVLGPRFRVSWLYLKERDQEGDVDGIAGCS
jgi:hypothetical protein